MQSDQSILVQIQEGNIMFISGQTYDEKQKAFDNICQAVSKLVNITKTEVNSQKRKMMKEKIMELISKLEQYKKDLNLMKQGQQLQKMDQKQYLNHSIDKSMAQYKFQCEKNIQKSDFIASEQLTLDLMSCIELPIKFPAMFKQLVYSCILIYGPPGDGKTYYGMVLQSELKEKFYKFNVFDFLNKDQSQFIAHIFQEAKKQEAALLFFDEIDSIINEAKCVDSLCNQFEILYKEKSKVQIIATTNRPWGLPDKLLFYLDKKIYFAPPNYENRCLFIKNKLQDKLCQNDLSDEEMIQLVDQTQGYQYSEIDLIFREANMQIIRRIHNTKYFKKVQKDEQVYWMMTDEKDPEGVAKDYLKLDNIFIPKLNFGEFQEALKSIKQSLNDKEMQQFDEWGYTNSKSFR